MKYFGTPKTAVKGIFQKEGENKVNRKFISFAAAAAIFCSQAVGIAPALAQDEAAPVYSCDFSDEGDVSSYKVYDSVNGGGSVSYDAANQRLSATFTNGWNEHNGVKTDITEALKDCEADDAVKASVKFTSTTGGETVAKSELLLEIENASGEKQLMLY